MLIIMGVTKGGQGVSWPPWTLNIPFYVLVLAQYVVQGLLQKPFVLATSQTF